MMKLRSSFLNKRIIIDNILRCWPISVIVFLISLLTQTIQVYSDVNYYKKFPNDTDIKQELLNDIQQSQIFVILTAFAAAYLVFRYLFSERLCNQIHSFPLKRKTLLLSNALSGFLMIFIPQIVNWFIMMPAFGSAGDPALWFECLLCITAYNLIFYAIAVFSAMITGTLVSMGIVYALINFFGILVGYLSAVCEELFENRGGFWITLSGQSPESISHIISLIFPFTSATETSYSPDSSKSIVYNVPVLMTGKFRFIIYGLYVVLGCLLIFASYKIYSRRQLETAGSSISFKPVKSVIYLITQVMASALVYFVISSFFDTYGLLDALLLVISGIFISCGVRMLLDKTVTINFKAEIIKWISVVTVILFAFTLHSVYVNRYIPKEEKIEKIYLTRSWSYSHSESTIYNSDNVTDDNDNINGMTFLTDKDDIRKILDIHKDFIGSKKLIEFAASPYNDLDYYLEMDQNRYFEIEYVLSDGRRYYIYFYPDEETKEIINKIYTDNYLNTLAAYMKIKDIESTDFYTTVAIGSVSGSEKIKQFDFTQAEIKDILKAYALDMQQESSQTERYYISISAENNADPGNPRFNYIYYNASGTYYDYDTLLSSWRLVFTKADKRTVDAVNRAAEKYGFSLDDVKP